MPTTKQMQADELEQEAENNRRDRIVAIVEAHEALIEATITHWHDSERRSAARDALVDLLLEI